MNVQTLALAVLAQVGEALVGGFSRAADPDGTAIELDALDTVRAQAEQALDKLGPPGTDQAGKAKDLARLHLEAYILGPAWHRQALHLQQGNLARRHRVL